MNEFMAANYENPNACRPDIDITKNYLQMMIWAHNRRSSLSLTAIGNEIQEALRLGNITWHEADTLGAIVMLFLEECKEAKNGAAVAQRAHTISPETAAAGTMEGVLSYSEGDRGEGCAKSYSG